MADDAPRLDRTCASRCWRWATAPTRSSARSAGGSTNVSPRLAAPRIVDRIECDLDFEAPANALDRRHADATEGGTRRRRTRTTAVIHVDFARAPAEASAYTRTRPFEAEITERIRLTGSRSLSETWHIELSLEGSGIAYEPGDSLGVVPRNDPALVDAVLAASGLDGDAALRAALSDRFDITTLTAKQVEDLARLTGDASLAADAAFVEGRQVIDLLEAAPHRLTADQLTALLRPLPPRYYSIASSRKAVRRRRICWSPACATKRMAGSAPASPRSI